MIEFIVGKVDFIDTQYIVIETNGIGYQIFCANPFVFQSKVDQTVKVFTYQHVREDAIRLYGFQSRQERMLFEKLLNVSGIGPKGALAILASGRPETVVTAIEEEDDQFLVNFPGVGKKTARQMILDLKGKLEEFVPNLVDSNDFAEEGTRDPLSNRTNALYEAKEALKALGYVDKEIKKIEPELKKEQLTTDEYIKKALQLMLSR